MITSFCFFNALIDFTIDLFLFLLYDFHIKFLGQVIMSFLSELRFIIFAIWTWFSILNDLWSWILYLPLYNWWIYHISLLFRAYDIFVQRELFECFIYSFCLQIIIIIILVYSIRYFELIRLYWKRLSIANLSHIISTLNCNALIQFLYFSV